MIRMLSTRLTFAARPVVRFLRASGLPWNPELIELIHQVNQKLRNPKSRTISGSQLAIEEFFVEPI
jgi:hypothetical protein